MAIIKGGELMLFISNTETGGFKSIAQATNHTLTITANTSDISTKDINAGKWTAVDANTFSWTVTSENLVCDDPEGVKYEDLVEYMINGTEIHGVFGQVGNQTKGTNDEIKVPTGGWTPKTTDGLRGRMIITNLVKNAPVGDNASFTVDFTGIGPLAKFGSGSGVTVLSAETPVKVSSK